MIFKLILSTFLSVSESESVLLSLTGDGSRVTFFLASLQVVYRVSESLSDCIMISGSGASSGDTETFLLQVNASLIFGWIFFDELSDKSHDKLFLLDFPEYSPFDS